jgi:hypothetical protein
MIMEMFTPERPVCRGELNWTVAHEDTGVAYNARCPRCGTLYSSGSLPLPVEQNRHCSCLLSQPC